MRKIAATLLLLSGLLLAQGCGQGKAPADQGVAVRGAVIATGELPGDPGGSLVLVEGKKEDDTKYDNASVSVPKSAKVYKLQDGKKVKATPLDLKSGQKVEVKFTGEVMESNPVQAQAAEVVITDAGPAGTGKGS
ncbi:DUF3221 domain-containing protein [Paenibacillus hodogayensis]|uniref:DUF3221 domain-containing protein n=1 Tax=Paenibacillus hodogayensis TaxID=279208 RepID=A0ABV5W021_9BACL